VPPTDDIYKLVRQLDIDLMGTKFEAHEALSPLRSPKAVEDFWKELNAAIDHLAELDILVKKLLHPSNGQNCETQESHSATDTEPDLVGEETACAERKAENCSQGHPLLHGMAPEASSFPR